MKYNAEHTRRFYNKVGAIEWGRLERDAYGRLQGIIHEDFIRRYVSPGCRVIDAGSGPGRFSIAAADCGATVTVLDISDTQLEIAGQKIGEAGFSANVDRFIRGDIADLSVFPGDSFDVTVCFGGPLTYVCEKRFSAAEELLRVTKPGGIILVSVMSLMGTMITPATIADMSILENPDKEVDRVPPLWPIFETGYLPPFPSGRIEELHAGMHLYTADDLSTLFTGHEIREIAGSNVTLREHTRNGDAIAESPKAWETLVELEKKLNHDPGLVNSGSHIIMAVRK